MIAVACNADDTMLNDLSYSDFVARMGQANSPPGGAETVGKWVALSGIDAGCHVLDLACSTGYSGRTIAGQTGCSATGVDISPTAIDAAKETAHQLSLGLKYLCCDACDLPFRDSSFSHSVCGSAFGFFHDRARVLNESCRVLKPGGFLCTATFVYDSIPPAALVSKVNDIINGSIDPQSSVKTETAFFSAAPLVLAGEDRFRLPVLSHDEVARSCLHDISDAQARNRISQADAEAALNRHVYCRLVFNEHRRYQSGLIQIWRHD